MASRARSTRDISPIGASRFERPYTPPPSLATAAIQSVHLNNRPARYSIFPPVEPVAAPASPDSSMDSSTPRSRHQQSDSVFSYTDTVETAPTSLSISSVRESKDCDENMQVVSPTEWQAHFQRDADHDNTRTDECPDSATLETVQNMPIYDADGNEHKFGSVYAPSASAHQRQLVIFVRHFYCGACQAYLQALTNSISPSEYFSIPTPTSIIVIGCGKPEMIAHYKRFTNCPFTMYADPSRSLFKKLGMNTSLNFGNQRPQYMKDIKFTSWQKGQISQVRQELKNPGGIRKRDVLRGGNLFQIGGEFLFEEGRVVWCHRMKNFRDHAEIPVIRKLLELEDNLPICYMPGASGPPRTYPMSALPLRHQQAVFEMM